MPRSLRRSIRSSRSFVATADLGPINVLSREARREIAELVRLEGYLQKRGELAQWRSNMLALLYRRQVQIDFEMECPYRMLHPDKGWQRGRAGMIPSRANMELSIWRGVVVRPEVADQLIARDGADLPPLVSSVPQGAKSA